MLFQNGGVAPGLHLGEFALHGEVIDLPVGILMGVELLIKGLKDGLTVLLLGLFGNQVGPVRAADHDLPSVG